MRTSIITALTATFLWVFNQSVFAMDPAPPAEVAFFGSGLTVQAPAGATQLELRVVDPQRQEVFEQRTNGEDIHWTLQGTEGDGEYRFEAVSVVSMDGELKQRNTGGGFEVQGGVLIGPPDAAEIEARLSELSKED